MKTMPVSALAAVVITTSLSILSGGRAAIAAEPTTSIDCTRAEALLGFAVSRKASTIRTGDVDKDFEALMMQRLANAKRIDQIEAKCGKDAKMQAMGAKASVTAQQLMAELQRTK